MLGPGRPPERTAAGRSDYPAGAGRPFGTRSYPRVAAFRLNACSAWARTFASYSASDVATYSAPRNSIRYTSRASL